MKAIVTIRTWKKAANPTTWKKFDVASEERFLFEAEDLYHAELKVLESFPAEKCIGFNINMENGDFYCGACKDYFFEEGENPTDEELRERAIKGVKKSIKDEEDVNAGRKMWIEDVYSPKGDMILVDVTEDAILNEAVVICREYEDPNKYADDPERVEFVELENKILDRRFNDVMKLLGIESNGVPAVLTDLEDDTRAVVKAWIKRERGGKEVA